MTPAGRPGTLAGEPGGMIGGQTEVSALRRALLKRPLDAFTSTAAIELQWEALGFTAPPELDRAAAEHAAFVSLLEASGVECVYLPRADSAGLDSIYARDASVVCERGVILCNMGKAARGTEPAEQRQALERLGTPIVGEIGDEGRLEGGDVVWLDERTVAVGRGYRTNDEGIRQLRALLAGSIDELIVVPLPHWRGPTDVFHLMSVISPIDRDLALVYSPLLPVSFREELLRREVQLVEVPEREFETMGCNVLAVAPRDCIALAGNPETRARLEAAGATVREYPGEHVSRRGGGGPTCLTRPLLRDPSR